MRKLCCLISALLSVGFATAAPLPNEVISGTMGEIRIQGVLLGSTCQLSMNTATQSVDLGVISAKSMTKAGIRSEKVPFQLHFTGCLIGAYNQEPPKQRLQVLETLAQGVNTDRFLNGQSAVVMTLVGEPDERNLKLLKVSGEAVGVGVHFSDEAGRSFNMNEPNRAYVLAPGAQTLVFFADLESTQAAVRAGAFSAVVNVRLSYL
ncbi:MAG: type 1 fimbrial protein [Neisseriaceae bacterium]|nr:type 1 fimbrial protein [Neisseriaceae bacterium]